MHRTIPGDVLPSDDVVIFCIWYVTAHLGSQVTDNLISNALVLLIWTLKRNKVLLEYPIGDLKRDFFTNMSANLIMVFRRCSRLLHQKPLSAKRTVTQRTKPPSFEIDALRTLNKLLFSEPATVVCVFLHCLVLLFFFLIYQIKRLYRCYHVVQTVFFPMIFFVLAETSLEKAATKSRKCRDCVKNIRLKN